MFKYGVGYSVNNRINPRIYSVKIDITDYDIFTQTQHHNGDFLRL